MKTFERAGLTGAAVLALMLGMAIPAGAAETMCNAMGHDSMAKDMMSDDTMMKDEMMDDTMSDDAMMKDEAMMDDGMAHDDMAHDDMAKNDMAMSDDTMSDGMMKDDAMSGDMAHGDMMMGEYVVKPGDSLWKIAAVTLCDGDRYPEIVAANKDMLGAAMMVHPGDKLMIPGD